MLFPLDLEAGLYRNGTRYQSAGRWYDCDLVRWLDRTVQPIGGWRRKSSSAVEGKARAVHTWVDDGNQSWCAIGTNEGLFVVTRSGVIHNITPEEFSPGPANASVGGGYGRGYYGQGLYGTPRPDGSDVIPAMVWTLDNIGQFLVACDGENIYLWELDTAEVAAPMENAPTARAVMVTDERIVWAIGAGGNPRKVEWSDAEDFSVWTPAGTNLAGGSQIQTPGSLENAKRISGGYLLFSDADAYLATYVGLPDVYAFERIGTNCGLAAKQACAVIDGRAFWMGQGRFWAYAGVIDPLPLEIEGDFFDGLNAGQVSKVSAVRISEFSEIWWLYPSKTSIECDRYMALNYQTGRCWWGAISRLSGTDRGVFAYPLMVDGDGYLYEHEVGSLRDDRRPFVVSGPVEIGNGDRTVRVDVIVPDERNLGDVEASFIVGDYPNSTDEVFGPYPLTDWVDVRFEARRVMLDLTATTNADFRIGRFRVDGKAGAPR